jgi:hypothetical protein
MYGPMTVARHALLQRQGVDEDAVRADGERKTMNRRDAIAALVALPAVTRIAVADLKPSDVLVIEASGYVSAEATARIEATMAQVWPGRKVVLLDVGLTLKVVAG